MIIVYKNHLLLIVASILAFFGCEKTPMGVSQPQTFIATKVTHSEVLSRSDFMLGFAESAGIPYRVFRDTVQTGRLPNFNRSIRVEVGPLSHEQYTALMNHYSGQSLVPYAQDKIYNLIDFLPPKIQALANRWLVPTNEARPEVPKPWRDPRLPEQVPVVSTLMNCWTTSLEILRDWETPFVDQEGVLFYVGPYEIETTLQNSNYLRDAHELSPEELELPMVKEIARDYGRDGSIETYEAVERLKMTFEVQRREWSRQRNLGRQPGDLLYIDTQFATIGPAHTAIWIDDDLYFEKTNAGADDPFRLALWNDVVAPYQLQYDPEGSFTSFSMQFLRYHFARLPHPKSFAGIHPYNESLEPLLDDLADQWIFTNDLGLGGGLTSYVIAQIRTFAMEQNPTTMRAVLKGANLLDSYVEGESLCDFSSFEQSGFRYLIDRNLRLSIRNKTSGREIASIPGEIFREAVQISDQRRTVLVRFETPEKSLYLYKGDHSQDYRLSHPEHDMSVFVNCVQSPEFLF